MVAFIWEGFVVKLIVSLRIQPLNYSAALSLFIFRLMKSIETVSDNIVLLDAQDLKFILPRVALLISCQNFSTFIGKSVVLQVNGPQHSNTLNDYNITLSPQEAVSQNKSNNSDVVGETVISFKIPSTSISSEQILWNSSSSCPVPQLSFSIFMTDKLFQNKKGTDVQTTSSTVISKIVNAHIGRKRSVLEQPVEMVFAISHNKTVR